MKDKHGNELGEQRDEVIANHMSDPEFNDDPYFSCHNCHKPLHHKYTYRFFTNNATQGPLCPECSELPASHLPSRKLGDRWW